MNYDTEVNFNAFCPYCKYYDCTEDSLPCNDCLSQGYNTESQRPWYWASKTGITEKEVLDKWHDEQLSVSFHSNYLYK